MKHEWKKAEKEFYLPPKKPTTIVVPAFQFFSIKGKGNPNDPFFSDYIGVLYALSYAVKMSYKSDLKPDGYFEYTVYPLEGVWDLDEEGKKKYNGTLDKNHLVFHLMMRQPSFVTQNFSERILERTRKKKPHPLLDQVEFHSVEEGKCVQMMHIGSYDDEPASFRLMEQYASENNLRRTSHMHREIYLSDARKISAEKLKTVLRFQVTD